MGLMVRLKTLSYTSSASISIGSATGPPNESMNSANEDIRVGTILSELSLSPCFSVYPMNAGIAVATWATEAWNLGIYTT